jgi:hypothetical protein
MTGFELQSEANRGGAVYLPPGPVALTETLRVGSRTRLILSPDTVLRWDGDAGDSMISNVDGRAIQTFNVTGGRIAPRNAGRVFDLHSPQFCWFNNLRVLGGSPDLTVMRIRTNGIGLEPPFNQTACMNKVDGLWVESCGTVLDLDGQEGESVTNSYFANIDCRKVFRQGYWIRSWTDNVVFGGMHRLSLQGDNTVGVILGSPSQRQHDVYSLEFHHLAIDTFPGYKHRAGMRLFKCKDISGRIHNNPPVDELIDDRYCLSYDFTLARGLSDPSKVERITKGQI